MPVNRQEILERTTCLNNLKQIQAIVETYKKDNRKSPFNYESNSYASFGDFTFAVDYVEENDLDSFHCPGDDSDISSIADLDGGTSYSTSLINLTWKTQVLM